MSGFTRVVSQQKEKKSVPIFGLFRLIRQIGSVKYSCERWFRAKLAQWLRTIRVIWPECPCPNRPWTVAISSFVVAALQL
jgi:hypothetical protein